MPGLDKTGPLGAGQMTGRRMGFCAGANANERFCRRNNRGRVFRQGRGRNSGFNQNLDNQTLSQQDEKQFLQEQKEFIQRQLEEIENKLEKL